MGTLTISLGTTDDSLVEGPENFQIGLSGAGSTTGAAVTIDAAHTIVPTQIQDNDTATWSITGSASVGEGTAASYAVALGGQLQSGETASVVLTLSDGPSPATTSADYASFDAAVQAAVTAYNSDTTAATPGTLSYVAGTHTLTFTSDGAAMGTLTISLGTTDDSLVEGPENFQIGLSGAGSTTGAAVTIDAAHTIVPTQIQDNDTATWSITGSASVGEGTAASYAVALGGQLQSGETASVVLTLSDGPSPATTSADYASFDAAVQAA